MDEKEHWMTRQLKQVSDEAKTWPTWRHEEAKRRFGSDFTEQDRLPASTTQNVSLSAPTDTSKTK